MRVVIAGAGSVGRSVARELIDKDHSVLLIDQSKEALGHERVPGAEWLLSDACELAGLAEAGLEEADVVVAATGDDKTNQIGRASCRERGEVEAVGGEWTEKK